MSKKLNNHEDIKKYVIKTIKSGNKKRIKKVLKRYQEWIKEQKNSVEEQIEMVKEW